MTSSDSGATDLFSNGICGDGPFELSGTRPHLGRGAEGILILISAMSKAEGLFLQAMLLEHAISERRAHELYHQCLEQYPQSRSLDDAIIKMSE